MVSFLIFSFPIFILVIALIGIGWSVKKSKKYLFGYILLLLGVGTHFYGLGVGAWDGMAISLFGGGGFVLVGLLVLLITLMYSKMAAN